MAEESIGLEVPAVETVHKESAHSPTYIALRRLLRKKIATVALIYILFFYAMGTLAPVLPLKSYTEQNLDQALQGPSWSHPFGTDRLGRDQLSRVAWSAQTTVIITVATLVTGGLVLAVGLGLLSGYAGGWVDSLIMRIGDIFASLPGLLMLILINATLKDQVRAIGADVEDLTGIGGIVRSGAPDYLLVFGALSMFSWVGGARMIRSQILVRHLLPNVSNMIIVSLSLGLGGIALSEIGLTWFGVGIQPPRPSFGVMIYDSSNLRTVNAHFYLLAFPASIVITLFFAFNLLGDALTDVFTPKTR